MRVLCRLMGVMVLMAATSRVAAAAPVIFTDELCSMPRSRPLA